MRGSRGEANTSAAGPVLDELPEIEEGDVVGDPPRLAEDVGDDDDGIVRLEADKPPLDDAARLRDRGPRSARRRG